MPGVEAAPLHVVAWESTRACNLACVHCRASAQTEPARDELETSEVKALIDDIAGFSRPVLIISGGEPLMRRDVFEIARYGHKRGLRVVMSPNGTLLTDKAARRMVGAGVARISVSIDGSTAARHDSVRGVAGAFTGAMQGLAASRAQGLPFQLNATVLRQTVDDLPAMHRLAIEVGAAAWHVFMLVPTGRGKPGDAITPAEYERVLRWLHETAQSSPLPIRVTCGPQYMRLAARDGGGKAGGMDRTTRGCLAGNGYCFISHRGEVFPCGYLPLAAGNVRERPFHEIYQQSELFQALRDPARLEGRCGVCGFAGVCGGCRARAYSATGNIVAEDPLCAYRPRRERGTKAYLGTGTRRSPARPRLPESRELRKS